MSDRPTLLNSRPASWVTAGALFVASVAGGGGTGAFATSFKLEALEHKIAEHKQDAGAHAGTQQRLRQLEEKVAVLGRDGDHLRELLVRIDGRLERIEEALAEQRPRRR